MQALLLLVLALGWLLLLWFGTLSYSDLVRLFAWLVGSSCDVHRASNCIHTQKAAHSSAEYEYGVLGASAIQYGTYALQFPPPVGGAAVRPEQDPLEGLPELGAEDSIDDRVERRVEVAQPEEQRRYGIVDVAGFAQGQQ